MIVFVPNSWGYGTPSKWPNFMAKKHGGLPTTYDTWDDPPSRILGIQKLHGSSYHSECSVLDSQSIFHQKFMKIIGQLLRGLPFTHLFLLLLERGGDFWFSCSGLLKTHLLPLRHWRWFGDGRWIPSLHKFHAPRGWNRLLGCQPQEGLR